MQSTVLYGIPNCDTVKKAMQWLKENEIDVTFYNFKTQGVTKQMLADWCKKVDYQILLNKKSTTWRQLDKADQDKVINQSAAIELMVINNTIIKRPVVEIGKILLIGFDETHYHSVFKG
jgi:arsenate reductase (glutaredoxin)